MNRKPIFSGIDIQELEVVHSSFEKKGDSEEKAIINYEDIIRQFFDKYIVDEHFIHVGQPRVSQGWLLHITVIPKQMEQLLLTILPDLLNYNLPFKVIKNKSVHSETNAGFYGKFKIGKIVTIYLDNETILSTLLPKLIESTASFTGPQVLTDFWVSSNIHTRYGSFISQVKTDSFENKLRIIKDASGNDILDRYYSPPIAHIGFSNPFISILKNIPKQPRLFIIGGKYMAIKLIKSDTKGNVWRGLCFRKYCIPKWCLIKQGKKGMFPDEVERDIRDRLSWQYQISAVLDPVIPTAKAQELIVDNEQSYLILSYIKRSKDLIQVVFSKINNTPWFDQSNKVKQEILDILLQIVISIQVIHQLGYIHRDITGTNFLVTKKNKVYLIDFELIYSINDKLPKPPFGKGTYGYMSPQQEANNPPSIKDDIYSLGSLFMMTFCGGIEPIYLIDSNSEILSAKLHFLINDPILVNLILNCLSMEAENRPSTDQIHAVLQDYKFTLQGSCSAHYPALKPDLDNIKHLVQLGIDGFSDGFMANDNLWYSRIENEYGWDIYPLGNKHSFGGVYRGVGGVIWLLNSFKSLGYNIDNCKTNIQKAFEYINLIVTTQMSSINPSLYFGKAGIALTLSQSIQSKVIADTTETRNIIFDCFQEKAASMNIIYGISGQGIAILQCLHHLNNSEFESILNMYSNIIINSQSKDGSWTESSLGKKEKLTGFGYGVAGIVYFLLEYGYKYKSIKAIESAKKGLHFLKKQLIKKNGHFEWSNSDTDKNIGFWWCKGGPGIALTFLKAYELFKEQTDLEIATRALYIHPRHFLYHKLSQCHGLSGLGEIYLEAFRITKNQEWWERAAWICNLIVNLRKHTSTGAIYWQVEKPDIPTTDLMIGNGGVLHFLARFSFPDELTLPLFPKM